VVKKVSGCPQCSPDMFAKEIIYDNIRIVVIFFVHLFLGQLTEQAIKLSYMYGILYVSYIAVSCQKGYM
jgi:hypothetical protein